MASRNHGHPAGSPGGPAGRRAAIRRWTGLLTVAAVLLVLVVVAVVAGWAGWLVHHPGQAWQWVVKRWLASSALVVVVAALGWWVSWAGPRRQQRRTEQRAAGQQAREQAREADRVAQQAERREAAARQAAWARRCRSLLAVWPLPMVDESDPYQLGVSYSRRAEAYRGERDRPPYVPRAADEELAGLLRSQPLVLVKGQSRAGKSRTTFEVAARELGDWRLVACWARKVDSPPPTNTLVTSPPPCSTCFFTRSSDAFSG